MVILSRELGTFRVSHFRGIISRIREPSKYNINARTFITDHNGRMKTNGHKLRLIMGVWSLNRQSCPVALVLSQRMCRSGFLGNDLAPRCKPRCHRRTPASPHATYPLTHSGGLGGERLHVTDRWALLVTNGAEEIFIYERPVRMNRYFTRCIRSKR